MLNKAAMNQLMNRLGLHRPELRAWALYDWANSAFATTIVAVVLPRYYVNVAAADLPAHTGTAYWGYTASIGLLIVAVLSPFFGTLSDLRASKKFYLGICVVTGVVASALLYFVEHFDWLFASCVFTVG